MRVFVYRNLHKQCFSVKSLETGLVVFRVQSLKLVNCEFKVSEAGRKRVLKEKRKNVHAGVVGDLVLPIKKHRNKNLKKVSYNPYLSKYFLVDNKPIFEAKNVIFKNGKDVYV